MFSTWHNKRLHDFDESREKARKVPDEKQLAIGSFPVLGLSFPVNRDLPGPEGNQSPLRILKKPELPQQLINIQRSTVVSGRKKSVQVMSGDLDLNADGVSVKPVKGGLSLPDSEATVEVAYSGAETLVDSVNGLKESVEGDEDVGEVERIDELKDAGLDCSKFESGDGEVSEFRPETTDLREQEEEGSEKAELYDSSLPRGRVSKDDVPTMGSENLDDHKMEVDEQETDEKLAGNEFGLQEKKGGKSNRAVASSSSKGGRSRSKFGDSDLVWAKVRSHPWWPGQIFDASMASDKAKKYMKKERHLVAYFGDQSFAWNETSKLKPFRPHFPQLSKQSNLEDFHDAVDDALDEVSRRAEFGLSCPCVAEHNQIRTQVIVNPGVKDEFCTRDGGDRCSGADSFRPEKLVECIKRIGQSPMSGVDRLEFVTARSQLLAFSRWKGFPELPELQVLGTVLDEAKADVPLSAADEKKNVGSTIEKDDDKQLDSPVKMYSSKRKRQSVDGEQLPAKKEKTLADFIAERRSNGKRKLDREDIVKSSVVSVSAGKKKRKAADSDSGFCVGAKKSNALSTPEGSKKMVNNPKGSFGIGYSILKVAGQMNNPSPILKSHKASSQKSKEKKGRQTMEKKKGSKNKSTSEKSPVKDDSLPAETAEDLLQSPVKDLDDPESKVNAPAEVLNQEHGEEDEENGTDEENLSEGNENVEAKTPTDKVIEEDIELVQPGVKQDDNPESQVNSPAEVPNQEHREEDEQEGTDEENLSEGSENGEAKTLTDKVIEEDIELLVQPGVKQDDDNDDASVPEQLNTDENVDDVKEQLEVEEKPNDDDDACPTALILNFTDIESVPSVENLNKIFSRFGKLEESETQVLKKSSRAKVVFRCRDDAETAFSSAGKYSTFGPSLVSYRLKYTSSPKKPSASTPKRG